MPRKQRVCRGLQKKASLLTLSRIAMLDLSDALTSGRLTPPYSAIRLVGYVPEAATDAAAADLARMDTTGMKPANIAECLQLLAAERDANQQTADQLQLVWTGPQPTWRGWILPA
jgi:hypothetical protein